MRYIFQQRFQGLKMLQSLEERFRVKFSAPETTKKCHRGYSYPPIPIVSNKLLRGETKFLKPDYHYTTISLPKHLWFFANNLRPTKAPAGRLSAEIYKMLLNTWPKRHTCGSTKCRKLCFLLTYLAQKGPLRVDWSAEIQFCSVKYFAQKAPAGWLRAEIYVFCGSIWPKRSCAVWLMVQKFMFFVKYLAQKAPAVWLSAEI